MSDSLRWKVVMLVVLGLGFLGCNKAEDKKPDSPVREKNGDKASSPSPADAVMKEMIQVYSDLADAHQKGDLSKSRQLERKLEEASKQTAALNLSEDDMKKLIEKHRDGLRKAMAKLAIYGRYNLTGDQFGVLNVPKEEKLTGSWLATHNPNAGVKFFGDDMAMTDRGVIVPATFKLDTSKNPKAIDIKLLIPHEGKSLVLGIYEIDDDTLKLCQSEPGGIRPTEFKDGPGQRLRIFKRNR